MELKAVDNDQTGDFRSEPRWSPNKKADVILRLLRGGSRRFVNRELGVEAHPAWRYELLKHDKEGFSQSHHIALSMRGFAHAKTQLS